MFVWREAFVFGNHEVNCNMNVYFNLYDYVRCVAEEALAGQRAARATRLPGAGGRRERERERLSIVLSDGRARLYG